MDTYKMSEVNSKMKTILFISPTGTFDNGAEVSIFNLMKYLVSQGYQVINIAPVSGAVSENDYSIRYKNNGIDCFLIQSQRWWWEEAPGHLFGSDVQRAASYRETISFISEIIKNCHVDLVITNTVNIFQGAVAAALESIPHFWLIHEFPENEFSYYQDKLDFIDKFSKEIFSVTGKLNEKLMPLFPTREIKTFAPYTDLQITQNKKGNDSRLVSVGRISERKNQLELIKAYDQLNRPDLELIFIGAWDEEYKKVCLDYIRKNNLKNIHFMGNVDNPWNEVTDRDICVFPSKNETFGLVYVEALLNGVPCILSDNPGHVSAYNIFKEGSLYSLGNRSELVELMKYTLDNFSQIKAHSIESISNVQNKYQIQSVYSQVIHEIENVAEENKLPIRHLANLLKTNEKKSKLAKFEYKFRDKLQKLKYKVFK